MSTAFPGALDTATTLYDAVNNATSTLSAGETAGETTLNLVSAALFPATGGIIYVGNERTTYTGKTSNQLTGMAALSNNYPSGTAVAMYVDAEHHNTLRGAIVAVETIVGATGSVVAGTVTKRLTDLEVSVSPVATQIHAAAAKAAPADADELGLADSAGAWALKKTTWSEIKAAIKSYYDSVTTTLTNKTLTTPQLTGGSFKYTLTGGSLAADRVLNVPVTTATDTLATLGLAQTWTAAQTFRAASAVRSEAAATQDAMVLAGRAGGSSSYAVTLTPTTLTGSRTVTYPDAATSIPVASYTYTFSGPTAARTFTYPDADMSVGYLNVPQNSQSTAYTAVLADAGKHLLHPSADTTARTFTIPANSSVAYPIGTALTFVNQASAGVMTIAITTDTMRLAGAGTTGSRTLAANGIATALKLTSTEWIISGTGLT